MGINDSISFKYSMGVNDSISFNIAWVLMIALVLTHSIGVNDSISKYSMDT